MTRYSGIPHKWAHRVANRQGRVAGRAGNVYYEGEKIYSYGGHFCMARLLPDNVVVYGTHTYSSSTASHQAAVRSAVSHLQVVYCHDPDRSASRNKDFVERDIEEALAEPPKLAKFKELKRLSGKVRARRLAETFNKYLAALPEEEQRGVAPFDLTKFDFTPEESARYAVVVAEERQRDAVRHTRREERWAAQRERREADMKAAAERAKTLIPDWRNHKYHHSMPYGMPTMLRLSHDKTSIETSRGANIPVSHAKRLWPIIENCRKVGQGLQGRDIRLGHYTLNEVRPDGSIVVGCHDIPYSEIELMAKELGLLQSQEA